MEGDSLAIVVGASHPWIGKARITPKLLTETCWILREPGSGTRSMFEAALKKLGMKLSDLDLRLELPSNEAVRVAVESGDCATANFGSGYSAVTGCRNASSSKDRFAGALVFSSCGTGSDMRARRKKSIVCLVPDVNENQSRYLSRSLTLAINPA